MYEWLRSYMSGRSLLIKVDNNYSITFILNRGVPQGSDLGSILFLIYIISIFKLKLRGRIIGLADDMAITYQFTNTLDWPSVINLDFNPLV